MPFAPQMQYKNWTPESPTSEWPHHITYKAGKDNEGDTASPAKPRSSTPETVGFRRTCPEAIKGYITKINERGKQLTVQIGPKMSSNLPIKKTIFKYNVFSRTKKVYNKPQAYFSELMRTCNKFAGAERPISWGGSLQDPETRKDVLSLLQGTPYPTEARGFRSLRPWLSLAEGQAPPQLHGLTDNPHLEKWKQNLWASKTLKKSAEGANEINGYVSEGRRLQDHPAQTKKFSEGDSRARNFIVAGPQQRGYTPVAGHQRPRSCRAAAPCMGAAAGIFQQNPLKKKIQWWWLGTHETDLRSRVKGLRGPGVFLKNAQAVDQAQQKGKWPTVGMATLSRLYHLKSKEYFLQGLSPHSYIYSLRSYWYYLYNEYFFPGSLRDASLATLPAAQPRARHKGDLIDLAEGSEIALLGTPDKQKNKGGVSLEETPQMEPMAHKKTTKSTKLLSDSVIAKKYKARFNKICKWSRNSNQADKVWSLAVKKKSHWFFNLNASPLWTGAPSKRPRLLSSRLSNYDKVSDLQGISEGQDLARHQRGAHVVGVRAPSVPHSKNHEPNQILLNHLCSDKTFAIYFDIHYNYLNFVENSGVSIFTS